MLNRLNNKIMSETLKQPENTNKQCEGKKENMFGISYD